MNWGDWWKKLDTPYMAWLIASYVELVIPTFDNADVYGAYTNKTEFGKAFLDTKILKKICALFPNMR